MNVVPKALLKVGSLKLIESYVLMDVDAISVLGVCLLVGSLTEDAAALVLADLGHDLLVKDVVTCHEKVIYMKGHNTLDFLRSSIAWKSQLCCTRTRSTPPQLQLENGNAAAPGPDVVPTCFPTGRFRTTHKPELYMGVFL